MVVTLFATPSSGVLVQSSMSFPEGAERLLGVEVPYLVFAKSLPMDGTRVVDRIGYWPMQDFIGMEKVEEGAFEALLDFSYHVTVGNMDEAFKAVKVIESDTVWHNMAAMCVKTRRLDVAEICLANMGHVRGVRALREACVRCGRRASCPSTRRRWLSWRRSWESWMRRLRCTARPGGRTC